MSSTAEIKQTPLYDEHVAAGGKIVPFAGWAMPVHFGSQLEEHHAVRRSVGLFDVSHMGQIFVEGPEALELVQRIVTRDIGDLDDGGAAYAALCHEDGTLADDLFVSRLAADRILLVVNAATYDADLALMQSIAARERLDARLRPAAPEWAMIAVQGPRWREACRAALGAGEWEGLAPIRVASMTYGGHELIFSTTGYTGEAGAELLCHPSQAVGLWRALVAAGARPCGLAARDTLRLESGFNLSGVDFTREHNPLEARLGWVTDLSKPAFSGREALLEIKQRGVTLRQVGLLPEGRRIPRHGNPVLADGNPVGEVTSGGFSPTLDRPIALGYVAAGLAKVGTELEIELGGGSKVKAVVAKLPFYKSQGEV